MSRKLTKLSLVLLASFTVFLPAHAQESGSGGVYRFDLSSETKLNIPAKSIGQSVVIGEGEGDSEELSQDEIDERLSERRLCSDLLAVGLASGDGVYEVDIDGEGAAAPVNAYCKMHNGRFWTLLSDFGAIPYYPNAIMGVGITNREGLIANGWAVESRNRYVEQDKFIQFYGQDSRSGWIRTRWPSTLNSIMVNYKVVDSTWSGEVRMTLRNHTGNYRNFHIGEWQGVGVGYKVIDNLSYPNHELQIWTTSTGSAYIGSIWVD